MLMQEGNRHIGGTQSDSLESAKKYGPLGGLDKLEVATAYIW